jgi:hypothetical protein
MRRSAAAAVLAGLGAWHCATRLEKTALRSVVWPLVLAVLRTPGLSMVRLHPHKTRYFNELVCGLAGASGDDDTDY